MRDQRRSDVAVDAGDVRREAQARRRARRSSAAASVMTASSPTRCSQAENSSVAPAPSPCDDHVVHRRRRVGRRARPRPCRRRSKATDAGIQRIGAHVVPRCRATAGAARSATDRPRRDSASARLLPTMPAPAHLHVEGSASPTIVGSGSETIARRRPRAAPAEREPHRERPGRERRIDPRLSGEIVRRHRRRREALARRDRLRSRPRLDGRRRRRLASSPSASCRAWRSCSRR